MFLICSHHGMRNRTRTRAGTGAGRRGRGPGRGLGPLAPSATGGRPAAWRADGAVPLRGPGDGGPTGLDGSRPRRPEAGCAGGPAALPLRRAPGGAVVRGTGAAGGGPPCDPCLPVGRVASGPIDSLGAADRVALQCAACGWQRSYRAQGLRSRLAELGEDTGRIGAEHVAKRIAWPCPRCARMRWRSRAVVGATGRGEQFARRERNGTLAENRDSVDGDLMEP